MAFSPLERKLALIIKGVAMMDIARQLDVTGEHVSMVVSGIRRSPRVEVAVAQALGEPVEKVFDPLPQPKTRTWAEVA